MSDIHKQMIEIGQRAKAAAYALALESDTKRSQAIVHAAAAIRHNQAKILIANERDIANAPNLSKPMQDRLLLTPERLESMAKGLEEIAMLPDPLGRVLDERVRPNGLKISKITVPLGVIGMIYEARPSVAADASALCIKSGNCVILRPGSESYESSRAIVDCILAGLDAMKIDRHAVQMVPTKERTAVGQMLRLSDYIDVIIPRGGKGLIERVASESLIPTLQHLDGNCHTYIHEKADEEKALKVLLNAKLRRTGICGATESLVIDKAIASSLLPKLTDALTEKGCELRGDAMAVSTDRRIQPATKDDFDTEYLDAILSIKVVSGLDEALAFVQAHSSHHTDAIITEDAAAGEAFLKTIDSAIVMHNTSTQFADGGEFGMGAEIGISTGKLHARGPVGVEELTTYKYLVRGDGQVRP